MKVVSVAGTSMWPALKTGDVVLLDDDESRLARPIRVGDLVLRSIDETEILHRLIGDGATKGDRFSLPDPRFADGETCARVGQIVPRRFASRSGRLKSASFDRPWLARLGAWQAALSQKQTCARSRASKHLWLAALVLNGSLIRAAIYTEAIDA